MVVLFALGSSLSNSLSFFFARVGLRNYNPFSGFVISLVALLVVSVTFALLTVPLHAFTHPAVLYFIIAGITGPFLSRFLFYIAIDRVGASITSPIHATKSLFATLAAILFLSESLTSLTGLGILLIVIGAASVSSEEAGGTIEKKWTKRDLLFPIAHAAFLGITNIFRKIGLNELPYPVMGVAVQNVTSLVFLPVLILAQKKTRRVISNKGGAWFIFSVSGLFLVGSQLCMYFALNFGQVAIVIPLSSLNPLFVLILVGIFLKEVERVTWKIVLGTIFIISGATLLSLNSL